MRPGPRNLITDVAGLRVGNAADAAFYETQQLPDDPTTAEEPGKILHELRRAASDHGDMHLPPVYYGTVDATSLWVVLLHDRVQLAIAALAVLGVVVRRAVLGRSRATKRGWSAPPSRGTCTARGRGVPILRAYC